MKILQHIGLLITVLFTHNSLANEPQKLIHGHGQFKRIKEPDFKTPKKVKAVFDVYTTDDDHNTINRGINTIARYLNMHFDAGLKQENIKAALVIHGPAGKDILNNAAYQSRFSMDNPNVDLLQKLHNQGVQIIICGQTAGFRGYEKSDMLDFVDLSLSAMTALISLQEQDFQLINFN